MNGLFTIGLMYICWQMTVRKKHKREIKRLNFKIEELTFKTEQLDQIIYEYEKDKIRLDDKC